MNKQQSFVKKGELLLCITLLVVISGLLAKGTQALLEGKAISICVTQ